MGREGGGKRAKHRIKFFKANKEREGRSSRTIRRPAGVRRRKKEKREKKFSLTFLITFTTRRKEKNKKGIQPGRERKRKKEHCFLDRVIAPVTRSLEKEGGGGTGRKNGGTGKKKGGEGEKSANAPMKIERTP